MTTWIARQVFPAHGKELRSYFGMADAQAVYWNAAYPYPKPFADGVQPAAVLDIEEVARSMLQAAEVAEAELETGRCYPRMWRPERYSYSTFGESEDDQNLILAIQATELLLRNVRAVFRTVQPARGNRLCYGHEIRALLMLACTEVETAWKGILKANAFTNNAGNWCTKDYVRLLSPLRLGEWAVRMPMFLDYGPVTPFANWAAESPSTSLGWYSAYNASKHDREAAFASASLEHLIEATAAAFVMVAAQVGPDVLSRGHYAIKDFVVARQPSWRLGEEYIPPIEFRPLPGRPGAQARVWVPVHYPFEAPSRGILGKGHKA